MRERAYNPAPMTDVEVAMEAARRGAAILLRYWEQLGRDDADLKARNDWVSTADRESERAIVESIAEHHPADAFLGEEGGRSGGTSARKWIIAVRLDAER